MKIPDEMSYGSAQLTCPFVYQERWTQALPVIFRRLRLVEDINQTPLTQKRHRSRYSSSIQLSSRVQHARPSCPSSTPRVYSNSCPLSQWWHPSIWFFVVPFSSCLQSFLASGTFQMSQFFISGGQSIGVSALPSVLPMNIQDWFPLGSTGWSSLQSKGLSRVSFNTTVQKHQFFSAQLSLWSNSHIHIWLLEKP